MRHAQQSLWLAGNLQTRLAPRQSIYSSLPLHTAYHSAGSLVQILLRITHHCPSFLLLLPTHPSLYVSVYALIICL